MTEQEDRIKELESQLEEAKRTDRETRQRVVEVARRYAQAHNMCEVVDSALIEAGLGPTMESVNLKITAPIELTMSVDASVLEGMTDEEKKKHVASQIRPGLSVQLNSHLVSNGLVPQPVGTGGIPRLLEPQITVGEFELEGFGVIEAPEQAPDRWTTPRGWQAKYSSSDARVLHFWPNTTGGIDYVHSMCGGQYQGVRQLRDYSSRGENRMCHRCNQQAPMHRR